VNWQAYYGNATTPATLAAPGSSGTPPSAMISGGTSAPTPGANVNATAAIVSNVTGFVPVQSTDGADQFIVYTNEYTIDGSLVGDFSWYSASMYSGDSQRVAVQIGGNWYASTSPVTPPVASSGGVFYNHATQSTLQFSTAAANWESLNFTPGSDLTLGSVLSSPLPSGSITGFGLYIQIANQSAGNEKSYFDTFELDSVPEPASGGLMCVGGLCLLARRRRIAEAG
jgi:hypothetical protein